MESQVSEVVGLIVAVALTPVLYQSMRSIRVRGGRWFVPAYAVLIVSYISTVLEAFGWPDVFNLTEHVGYAIAGILALLGVIELRAGIIRTSEQRR